MTPLRVMVVDDEPLARRRLVLMLRRIAGVELVGEAADGLEAVERLAATPADVVLLDIQMPRLDGFALAPRLAGPDAPVLIFVTAFDRHALHAWDHAAVGYLLKPVALGQLEAALERARDAVRARDAEERAAELAALLAQLRGAPAPAVRETLWVQRRHGAVRVPADRIIWIEAERDYVRLHLDDGSHLLRETIGGLAAALDPARFLRVHRSAVVQRDFIAEVRSNGQGGLRLRLVGGVEVPVGRTYAAAVRAAVRRGAVA